MQSHLENEITFGFDKLSTEGVNYQAKIRTVKPSLPVNLGTNGVLDAFRSTAAARASSKSSCQEHGVEPGSSGVS